MKLPAFLLLLGLSLLAAASSAGAREDNGPLPLPPGVTAKDVVRLQIFLDEQNFGPGKIDGQYGGFTRKSWLRYQQAQGLKPVDAFDSKTAPLTSIDPIYVSYTVTARDLASLGDVPEDLALRAKNKVLPYTTLSELLGERYHVSVNFLKRLNAPKNIDTLAAGGLVTVPNIVPPFQLDTVIALQHDVADREKARKAAAAAVGVATSTPPPGGETTATPAPADAPAPSSSMTPDASAAPTPSTGVGLSQSATSSVLRTAASQPILRAAPADSSRLVLYVNTEAAYLEIHDGDKLVACFPITPGSTAIPTPKGQWFVLAKTLLPEFRWDEAMLQHGVRSSTFFQLPPGPNNPVGIAWIALNRPGIGIHGTNDPDSIGRSASHGCIRLSNWDAFKVYGMVTKGTKVIIE